MVPRKGRPECTLSSSHFLDDPRRYPLLDACHYTECQKCESRLHGGKYTGCLNLLFVLTFEGKCQAECKEPIFHSCTEMPNRTVFALNPRELKLESSKVPAILKPLSCLQFKLYCRKAGRSLHSNKRNFEYFVRMLSRKMEIEKISTE